MTVWAPAGRPSEGDVEPPAGHETHRRTEERQECAVDDDDAEGVVGPGILKPALRGVPGGPGSATQRIHDPEPMQRRMEVDRR